MTVSHASAPRSSADDDDPFRFTDEDFRTIASILFEEAGISLSDSKASLVYSRLTKRLRQLGLKTFREYCALISNDGNRSERQKLIAALTTNVTRFFREPHHFEHLSTKIIAPRLQAIRGGARLRIWSSACSNGQEPYSIAMTVLSALPNAADLDVRILATDIDQEMIAAAKVGVYEDEAIGLVPPAHAKRWLAPVDVEGRRCWKVREEAACLVSFRELNLVGHWPMRGVFDAIFCRNVMIYFSEATQQMVWTRFQRVLGPGGALYIGHSERLTGPAQSHFSNDGVTTYRFTQGTHQ